jgi:hypothetical protein
MTSTLTYACTATPATISIRFGGSVWTVGCDSLVVESLTRSDVVGSNRVARLMWVDPTTSHVSASH